MTTKRTVNLPTWNEVKEFLGIDRPASAVQQPTTAEEFMIAFSRSASNTFRVEFFRKGAVTVDSSPYPRFDFQKGDLPRWKSLFSPKDGANKAIKNDVGAIAVFKAGPVMSVGVRSNHVGKRGISFPLTEETRLQLVGAIDGFLLAASRNIY